VIIVGERDTQLEESLRALGVQSTTVPVSELVSLAHPSATPPDAVLLDLRKDARVPAGVAGLKRQHPGVGLAILVTAFDQALMLEAMRAGVTECISSTDRAELEAAFARLLAQQISTDTGEAFVFVGAKGGVGTTTSAVNVATALVKIGSTLLIDLHATGGDAGLLLAAEPRFSFVDALENTHRLDAAYFRGLVARTKAGVDLLASSDRAVIKPMTDVSHNIRTLIDFSKRHYRFTVIDAPRSDSAALDALEAASALLVVTNQELATVRAAVRLTGLFRQRYGRDKVRVVVSRADRLSDISVEDLEQAVGTSVKHVFPSDYRLALDAMNQGRPLVLDNQTALAASYQACARELAGLMPERKEAVRSGGLFGRLTGRK
jgi:pilus assembly protein CpaE